MEHGWLTTLRKDGSPRTSRVWFVELGDEVWVATSLSTWKVADLGRDPRVSFAVEGRDGGRTMVGRFEAADSAPEVLAEFRRKYNGWDAVDPSAYGPRVLIRLVPRAAAS